MPAMAVGAAVSTMVALLAAADRTVLALFLGHSSPAMPIAQHIQLLGTWGYLLFGVTMVLFGTMRAKGAVIAPLVILAIGLLPLRIGFAALMQPLIGADALWLSLPVASLSNLVLASIYYRRGTWKRQRMTMN